MCSEWSGLSIRIVEKHGRFELGDFSVQTLPVTHDATEPIASSLGPIAFDRLAESLGARGVRACTGEDVARELRRAIAEPVVTVIHAPIVGGNP